LGVGFDVSAPDRVGEVDLDCGVRGLRKEIGILIHEIGFKFLTVTLNVVALNDI
jgi:hypothetical protein